MKKKKKKKIVDTLDSCIETEQIVDNKEGQIKSDYHLLSEKDRVTYIRLINSQNKISIVINVSYEVLIKNKWITIVRFDSSHGYLHRHLRISLEDPNTIIDSTSIIKKGAPDHWLPWAVKNLSRNYYEYKIGFCKRSKISILDI